jgi:hypothetical protein
VHRAAKEQPIPAAAWPSVAPQISASCQAQLETRSNADCKVIEEDTAVDPANAARANIVLVNPFALVFRRARRNLPRERQRAA